MRHAGFPIIDKLGGRDAVVERLRAAGHDRVTKDTARMWSARGRLPGWITTLLMQFAEAEEISYCSNDFIAIPTDKAAANNPSTASRSAQSVQAVGSA